ncbi:fluoride efflux transporter CrcB [Yinghuangia soli]|uniref:Fluoride-specific ion channel FluC n=1 Tax=Yinghuangia soli TaxID=2908204 RepID=A0AA41PW84_9ACTN|nr:fluoride efflux transporter CrcB [Yinghuangia soli]MCF2526762.1 fluoride efflux transporter CrcB [Yinghuangia soli]
MNWVFVVVGAAVGAPLRYLTDRAVQLWQGPEFPWGTVIVNVAGSAVLGFVGGAVAADAASEHVQLLVGTGFCGALTTYSAFSYETLRLAERGRAGYALANVVLSLGAGCAAAFAGAAAADLWWP